MIGCGLALNDTWFILVQEVRSKSVDDFIPKPRCSKFVVVLQIEGSKMGVQEVRSDSGLKG